VEFGAVNGGSDEIRLIYGRMIDLAKHALQSAHDFPRRTQINQNINAGLAAPPFSVSYFVIGQFCELLTAMPVAKYIASC
jgi:hypothetical protein